MIIIGNSLTRNGINERILDKILNKGQSKPIKAGVIYLDDTSIIEWYYLFKFYFYNKGIFPQKLVFNFALNQLSIQNFGFEELQRVSSYVPLNQLYEICDQEKFNHSQIIDIYAAKLFRIVSHRERIAKQILNFIPNYKSVIRKLNSSILPEKQDLANKAKHVHLKKLIELIDEAGVETIFCTMPLPKKYSIDHEIISIIKNSKNCSIAGYHQDKSFITKHFIDGYHLNSTGAKKFTTSYIEMITN